MRDVLIHVYGRVDLEKVWITLSEQLPALLSQIELHYGWKDWRACRWSSKPPYPWTAEHHQVQR